MSLLNQKSNNTAEFNIFNHLCQKTRRSALHISAILSVTLLSACGGAGDPNINDGSSGGNTGGTGTSVLASPDTVSIDQGKAVNIPVLSNDTGVSGSPVISIEVKPKNGNASIMANNTINYTPDASFTGKESFSYKLSSNNKSSIATVTVNVNCLGCAKEISVNLSWLPSKNDDDIGYLIYYGNNKTNINSLAFDLSPQTGLDPNNPKIAFSAQNDLKLNKGDAVCFQISAYTSTSQSNFSTPICGTI